MSKKTKQFGIIFDLDGTLLDSMDFFIFEIPKQIAKYYNYDISPLNQEKIGNLLSDVFNGKKGGGKFLVVKVIWKVAKTFQVPWFKRFKFLKVTQTIYKENISKVPLIPGVEKTLHLLKQKYNVKIGLNTTGSYQEVLDRFAEKMHFLEIFEDNIITRDRVKHLKPAPDGIFKLSKKWGIPPDHLIMVGDMDSDINAGKSAGTFTIGVLTGFLSQELMEELKPTLILKDVNQILDEMEKLLEKM